MADSRYVRINRTREEQKATRNRLLLGGAVALAVACVHPSGLVAVALLGAALLAALRKDPARESGAAGEEYTLSVLNDLPEEYVIFNQLEIPDPRSATGVREVDFVVCGPNGIFIVESKHHKGAIEGSENDCRWKIHKIGRRGAAYSDTIRNPVRQVKQQVYALSGYLKENGVRDWITGIVALSANNSTLAIATQSVPVVHSADLAEFILGQRGRGGLRPRKNAVAALAELAGSSAFRRDRFGLRWWWNL